MLGYFRGIFGVSSGQSGGAGKYKNDKTFGGIKKK